MVEEITKVNGTSVPPHKNELDHWYKQLLADIMANGTKKEDRTGTGTRSVFGRMFRHKMSDGFPLLTSKKMYAKGIITELLWFLGVHMIDEEYKHLGRTNIKYLVDNKCYIWVGDAYKRYVREFPEYMKRWWSADNPTNYNVQSIPSPRLTPHEINNGPLTREMFITRIQESNWFAQEWGDLGPIYGKQWCSWGEDEYIRVTTDQLCTPVTTLDELHEAVAEGACEVSVDTGQRINVGGLNQVNQLIHDLQVNPDSRRLMVTAWNPTDVPNSVLPPCHYGFQCYTRELSLEERSEVLGDPTPLNFITNYHISSDIAHSIFDQLNVPRRELSLSWNQRSVDTPLGLPFNIASYGFLLELLAKIVNMKTGDLIGYLGDTHIYTDQVPFIGEQMLNETFKLPTLSFKTDKIYRKIEEFDIDTFIIENYESAGKVDYPLSN